MRSPVRSSRPSEAAPFVLATPHHTMVWAQSFPGVFAALLAEYESRIAEYEQALAEVDALNQRGRLSADQMRQAEQLYQEYQAWVAEYQALAQQGQSGPRAASSGRRDRDSGDFAPTGRRGGRGAA